MDIKKLKIIRGGACAIACIYIGMTAESGYVALLSANYLCN